jgi:uncharacterized membrane protein (UPF0136 family)
MSNSSSGKSHKTLMRLVAANIVLDIIAIVIWAALPAGTWNGLYRLDSLIASVEAAVAAGLFAFTLYCLKRNIHWAPVLAIVLTVAQRVFAVYVFYPSYFIPVPLVWSLVIIYFAVKTLRSQQKLKIEQ